MRRDSETRSVLPPPLRAPWTVDRARTWLYAACALAMAGMTVVAFAPIGILLDHLLYEDFFYYVGVADHVVRGHGVTFDGTARTNGFQPLWMAVCVGIESVADGEAAVRLSLLCGVASHAAQALLLHRLLRRLCRSEGLALLATLFFLLGYRAAAWNLSGLEPPVQGLCVLLAFDRVVAWHDSERRRDLVLLGLCLGLNVWARFDALLFAAFAMASVLLRRGSSRNRLRAPLLAGGAMTLSLLPWFAWSLHQSGVLLPNCDAALAIWSYPDYGLHHTFEENWELLRAQLLQSSWGLGEVLTMMGLWPFAFEGPSIPAGIAWTVVVAGIGVLLARDRANDRWALRCLFWLWAVAHAGYYIVFTWAEPRYLMPSMLMLLVLVATLVDAFLQRLPRWRSIALGMYLLLCLVTVAAGVHAWHEHHGISVWHRYHGDLYHAAQWVRENTPPDAVVGGFNCGILGYHSERTVVNLDGVINDEAIEPLRRRELSRYIDQRRIGWIVDHLQEVEKFMNAYAGDPDWRRHWELVHTEGTVVVGRRRD